MSRVFDEISFHFSPKMKQALIAAERLSEIESENDYPDAKLVAACLANSLDLPIIRCTLLKLDLPITMAGQITENGLDALPVLEQACWDSFKGSDVPRSTADLELAGPFLGVGWGAPIYELHNAIAARPLGAAKAASLFVRVSPTKGSEIRLTVHRRNSEPDGEDLQVEVCGRRLATQYSHDELGREVLVAPLPDDLLRAHDGRLLIRVTDLGDPSAFGPAAFMRFEVSDTRSIEVAQSARSMFARSVLASLD
jgi:hypothetical protein